MIDWFTEVISPAAPDFLQQARERQNQLTKPAGSLGRLETLAIQISALQKTIKPDVSKAQILIFAADHGIAQEQVSAFPQAVTAEMVKNFSAGGAAISVLARQHKLPLQIINLGLITELEAMKQVENFPIAHGTKNFLYSEAMPEPQLEKLCQFIKIKVDQLKTDGLQLLICGEMGIANTTSATAVLCALENIKPERVTGVGTGIDKKALEHKINVIKQSINKHKEQLTTPLEILRILGGFEIAALCAAYLRCAQSGIISLVDGYICSVAALLAVRINPLCRDWLIFSHQSEETGHKMVLELLAVQPLLDFNLRLGEGSGAALSYPLLHSACLLQSEMSTFEEAQVSN